VAAAAAGMLLLQKLAKTAGLVEVAALKTLDLQHLQAVLVTRHQHHHHKATTAGLDIPGPLEAMLKLAVAVAVLAQ
jgi:hypothetical protein